MNRSAILLVVLIPLGPVLSIGCGNAQVAELGQETDHVKWEPLLALYEESYMGGIDYAVEMRSPNMIPRVATDPEFIKRVDAIEQTDLPSAWSDRTAEKEALVTALRELVSAAQEKKGAQALVEIVGKVKQATVDLRKPEEDTTPTP